MSIDPHDRPGSDGVLGTSSRRPGRPRPDALPRLITCSATDFAAEHWGRTPLLSSADELGGTFTDLLNAEAIDELVSERGLRTPFLRVAKEGSTLANAAFTAGGGIGAGIGDQASDDKLVDLFAGGSTMVLQGLHRIWPPIIAFCQQLAAELGHPVQANAYVTPPQNQGFDDHYDVHDVFVLQIDGEKEWTIHAPVLASPLRTQPWTDRRAVVQAEAGQAPLIKTVLRPGDCLYLPRGYLHAAQALGGISTHLTIGVHSWTRFHLAEQLIAAALTALGEDADARASLPFGVEVGTGDELATDAELVRDRLIEAIRTVPIDDLAAALAGTSRAAQRAAPVGPLRQLQTAAELGPDTRLRLRDHLQPSLELTATGSGGTLVSRAGRLVLTEDEVAPVRMLLQGAPCPAAELGLELSRKLLRAAVAVPSD